MTEKPSKAMPVIGIDLGTTNSAAATIIEGKPRLIPSPEGAQGILPSVVHRPAGGGTVVGSTAEAAKIAMPESTISAVKRSMGSDVTLALGDETLRPEEVSSLIVRELKRWALDYLQLEPAQKLEAVITVPAYFNEAQRRATKLAGELAGFKVDRIVNEPTAAAMAFGLGRADEDARYLVYDLGGGTFDVSIVETFSGILEVQASTGDSQLGGEDFDWLLVGWLAEEVRKEHDIDPLEDLRAKALLKQKAEETKKQLSYDEKVELVIPLLCFKDDEPVGLTRTITRSMFDEMILPLLEKTMEHVEDVLSQAEAEAADVTHVLLVGGSTRIPRVKEMMTERFGRPPRDDVHPDEAVALGAAVQAGMKAGLIGSDTLITTDVAPFSMGVAAMQHQPDGTMVPDRFAVVIPRNTTIPATRTNTFYTLAPGQTAVAIRVFQGESGWVEENHYLGEFSLEGLPLNFAEQEEVEVTFAYNLNGLLEVSARSPKNRREMSISIEDEFDRDSQEAFLRSVQRIRDLEMDTPSTVPGSTVEYEQPELPNLFDDFDDEDGESSPAELMEETRALLLRAKAILDELDEPSRADIQQCLQDCEKALEEENYDILEELADRLFAAIMDVELEDDA